MSRKDKKNADRSVPALYTTHTKGSMFRNGSVNPTLYLHIDMDEELAKEDPQYEEYFQEMCNVEIPQAIINKFVTSQPLKVTNDRIPFIIFKSNIDEYSLKEFCKAIVQEISYHTGKEHTAQYGFLKTMFSQIDKDPMFTFAKKGEKITRSPVFEELKKNNLEYDKNLQDQGIMCPYYIWKEEKRRQAEAEKEEQEEIVEW